MRLIALCATLGALALAACQTAAPPPAAHAGNRMLLNAGFTARKATTPAQAAVFGALPPNRMVRQAIEGKINYLYADPAGCNCVYVGNRAAFQNFKAMQNTMTLMTDPASIDQVAPGLDPATIDDLGTWSPI